MRYKVLLLFFVRNVFFKIVTMKMYQIRSLLVHNQTGLFWPLLIYWLDCSLAWV